MTLASTAMATTVSQVARMTVSASRPSTPNVALTTSAAATRTPTARLVTSVTPTTSATSSQRPSHQRRPQTRAAKIRMSSAMDTILLATCLLLIKTLASSAMEMTASQAAKMTLCASMTSTPSAEPTTSAAATKTQTARINGPVTKRIIDVNQCQAWCC